MAAKHTRLELTWIGKDERPRLEPRILLEDPELSYHAKTRVSDKDIFENMLIHGDNLLALKSLEQTHKGQIKCAIIDPPFNTQQAFPHYEDGVEHSLWLTLMRSRIRIIHSLLSDDGSLWIIIDENEVHYLKILCDEIFGRDCFVSTIVWRTTDNSNNNASQFSLDHNHILVFGKKPKWSPKFVEDSSRRSHFSNPDNDPRGPWFDGNPVNNPALRPNLQFNITTPNGNVIAHPPNGWRWSQDTISEKLATGELRFNDDQTRLIRRTYLCDMKALPPSSLWSDINETGHNRQAKYEQKKLFPGMPTNALFSTPKPERLISKIISLATEEGDWILDSFAGSGTTGAVAHKMKRKWVMIELGDHCYTFIIPRLKKVVDGHDQGGASEFRDLLWEEQLTPQRLYDTTELLANCSLAEAEAPSSYHGLERKVENGCLRLYGVRHSERANSGGGFRFFRLAPSFLERDRWGNWVVSKQYNPEMLAEAMCKLEGFRYAPDPDVFWIHGQSTETDLIYVTTQNLSHEQLQVISDQVGDERTLLICCSAFRAKPDAFANLTLKKIPQAVLHRCEWGRDDYSLNVNALPESEPEADQTDEETSEDIPATDPTPEVKSPPPARRRGRPRRQSSTMQELPLFANLDQGGDA